MAVLALLVTSVSSLPAQDGPRLVQNDRSDFVLPPAPSDSQSLPADSATGPVEQAATPAEAQRAPARSGQPGNREDAAQEFRSDRAVPPADESRENYLGVFTDPLPAALADQFGEMLAGGQGLLVTAVVNGAAADQAGLRVNDILVSYDGEPLASPDDLKRLVVADEPGARVELTVIRSAEKQRIAVTLGQRTAAPQRARGPAPVAPHQGDPFPIGVHLPGHRSIIVDRYGLRSPWVAVDWGSPLAGRRFQALTPDGRQFEVEVRVHPDARRGPYGRD